MGARRPHELQPHIHGVSQVALMVKEPPCQYQCRRCKRLRFDPWVGKIPLEKEMATHSSILAWKIPWTEPGGLQSMESGYIPQGSKESDTTEQLSTHIHIHTFTSYEGIGRRGNRYLWVSQYLTSAFPGNFVGQNRKFWCQWFVVE